MLMASHPTLDSFVKRGPYEVRHLLIVGDDPSMNVLIQISSGVRTELAKGTQYEMQKRLDELMQQWHTEGFRHDERAFEPWSHMLPLLTAMGYSVLYDPQLAKTQKMNPMGRVLLTQWTGRRGKDGSEYEYSFDGNILAAQPRVPSHIARRLQGATTAELPAAILEVAKSRDSIGATYEFILSDR